MTERREVAIVPLRMPSLPAKSMDTLARVVGHMACGETVEIHIRLHQGGVRAYRETVYPLHPDQPLPVRVDEP